MLGEALSTIFSVKVNSVSKILQCPTIHIDLAILLLKEVLLYFEEYRDSWFTNSLVKVKEITDKLTLTLNLKQLVEEKIKTYSRMDEPMNQ
jgi:hypothetical protein